MVRIKFASFILAGVVVAGAAGAIVAVSLTNAEKGRIGRIDEVFTVDATYEYGKSFTPSGKAYKSDVTFEYRKNGEEEWTETQPNRVGQYQMRAKAKGNSGYKYSQVQNFEIKPVDVDCYVNQQTINYGEVKPSVKVETLLGNDYFTPDECQVTFSSFKEETAKVNVVPDSVHIFSGSEDITYCYNINFIEKEIRFIPQNISISFSNVSKQYDGEAISSDEYTITSGSLKFNDHIVVGGGSSLTEPGTLNNNHEIKILDEDGDDVTLHYNITKHDNSLNITTIPLSIRSNSLTKTYDGEPFSEDQFLVEYDETKLIDGHHIEYEFTSANKDNYQVYGVTPNSFNYQILDAENNDVSKYYQVSTSTGTLSITKRSLSFRTKSINTTYDGEAHGDQTVEITSGNLATGDELITTDFNSYINAGNYSNSCNFSIKRGEVDVTTCYAVNKTQGTIAIKKIDTNFTFLSGNQYIYDGQPHSIYTLDENDNVEVSTDLDLANYHYDIKIKSTSKPNNQKTVYSASAYSLTRNDFNIAIYDLLDNDVTSNFNIGCTFESMTILKRDLTINTPDLNKDYDGNSLSNEFTDAIKKADFETQINANAVGLVDGHTIKYSAITTPNANTSNVGSGDFICSYNVVDSMNNNVAPNYNITINKGEYNINKVDLELTISCGSKVYDGTNAIYSDASNFGVYLDVTNGQLAPNTTISFRKGLVLTALSSDVGYYPVSISPDDIVITRNSADAKDNYNITLINNGSFVITKRYASVQQITDFTYYDEEYHGLNNGKDFETNGLVQGHKLTFRNAEMFDEVGTHYYETATDGFDEATFLNSFDPVIYDANNSEVTNNYDLHFNSLNDFGERGTKGYSYTIAKKHLTIHSHNANKIFDNKVLNPSITYRKGNSGYNGSTDYVDVAFDNYQSFDAGHTLTVKETGDRPLHVADSTDTTKNKNTFNYQILEGEKDVTDRYIIDVVYGNLSINRCSLNVYLKNYNAVYNSSNIKITSTKYRIGKDVGNDYAYLANSDPIPANHTLWCTLTAPTGDTYMAGTYNVGVDLILEEDTTPGTYNANDIKLTLRKSSLKWNVTTALLDIVTASADWTYMEGVAAPESRTVTGLKGTDKIYFGSEEYSLNKKNYQSVTDKIEPGVYTNEVGPYRIVRGSVDVTNCYQVTVQLGTIRITED